MTKWIDATVITEGVEPFHGIRRVEVELLRHAVLRGGVKFLKFVNNEIFEVSEVQVVTFLENISPSPSQSQSTPFELRGKKPLSFSLSTVAARVHGYLQNRKGFWGTSAMVGALVTYHLIGLIRNAAGQAKQGFSELRTQIARAITGYRSSNSLSTTGGLEADVLHGIPTKRDFISASPIQAHDFVITAGLLSKRIQIQALHEHKLEVGFQLEYFVHDTIPLLQPQWVFPDHRTLLAEEFGMIPWIANSLVFSTDHNAQLFSQYFQQNFVPLTMNQRIVPLATELSFDPKEFSTNNRQDADKFYFLTVSTIEKRKNHRLIVDAIKNLRTNHPELRLPKFVFAGRVGWGVQDLIHDLNNDPCYWQNGQALVEIVEGLDDQSIGSLYTSALATIFPSFHEGWGMPVSESLALGVPTFASDDLNVSIASQGCAQFFKADNPSDLAHKLFSFITDPTEQAKMLQLAGEFQTRTWFQYSEEVLYPDPPAGRTP